jgi:cytochrome P450
MNLAGAAGTAAARPKRGLPPGPRGVWHMWRMLRSPSAWLEVLAGWTRDYGNIVFFRFLGVPVCLINDPAAIEQVLVIQNQNFTKSLDYRALSRILGQGLLTSEGELWKRQRHLVQPAFYRERILSYGGIMTAYAARMAETWRDGEVRDVHRDMMGVTLEIAARCLFNVDVAGNAGAIGEALAVMMEDIFKLVNFSFLPDWMPLAGSRRFRRAVRDLNRIVYGMIHERRASGQAGSDLMGMLLEARDENGAGMPDRQLRDEVMTLLLAGHETTANTLAWTLYLLAQHPEVQTALAAEVRDVLHGSAPEAGSLHTLPFTQMVLMESQRLYPPAWAIGRKALAPFEVLDYRLPAGTNVGISQWILHRDPRYYPDPERFDPERWREEVSGRRTLPKFAYIPFGAGPRVCVGAGLAITEAALVLDILIQRFRFSLASEEPVEALPSVTLRPKSGLQLRIHKRT